ncbi:MAG TPA: MerR family transcriptional regulator [Sphingomicrobium sp.]|mgnify:CR=1 FL=1|nr:MerR family transcriptional regulator [Sphingomicrobium sp.]
MATGEKAPDAFRTIGELSAELGVAQHILRYWETKFPQLRPLQRAGNRRYYRQVDVTLARRIHQLLNEEGYTVKGVQKLLRSKVEAVTEPLEVQPVPVAPQPEYGVDRPILERQGRIDVERLKALREQLAAALED